MKIKIKNDIFDNYFYFLKNKKLCYIENEFFLLKTKNKVFLNNIFNCFYLFFFNNYLKK